MGYATAHPWLQALGFQPSALLPSEAAAVYLKYKGVTKYSHRIVPIRAQKLVPIRV